MFAPLTKPRFLSRYIHEKYNDPYFGSLIVISNLGWMWGYIEREKIDSLLNECFLIEDSLRAPESMRLDYDPLHPIERGTFIIREAHIYGGKTFLEAHGDVKIAIGKASLSKLKKGIDLKPSGGDNMNISKVTINKVNASDVGEVVSSAQLVEVIINEGNYERVNKIVHLYFEGKDPELDEAFEKAPQHIKDEFYKEMANTEKAKWIDKIKELKLSTYLTSVEKITDVTTKLYNLWEKINL